MKKGQILLITVMLLATVMTIVLSASFKSVTDTQVTKLEEENQKALAAAESAIEVALKNNNTATLGSGSLSSITGFSGTATIDRSTSTQFTTPSILKDHSHTFYLGDYDLATNTIGVSSQSDVTICFEVGAALEITVMKASGLVKYVVDPQANGSGRISSTPPPDITGSPCTLDSVNYSYSTTILGTDIGADGKLLIVKVLFSPSKLLFSSSVDLPIQGRTITSQATSSTSTGVSKKVVLFQSYPQVPGEFFTTAF